MLKLYHGSNVRIERIDLSVGHINKDFGKGFYLTTIKEQAEAMAKRKARLFIDAVPIVTEFIFDDSSLNDKELKVQTLGRGFAWLDTGTHDSLSEASTYIEVLEKRQGLKVACLEGIAFRKGWISEEKMRELAQPMLKNQYGQYLLKVIDEVKRYGKDNLD